MAIYYAESAEKAQKISNDFVDERQIRKAISELIEPSVGEIRFLAIPQAAVDARQAKIGECFVQSGGVRTLKAGADFDGWVFPDGQKYSRNNSGGKSVFDDAWDSWRTSGTEFEVPDMRDFVMFNPDSGVSASEGVSYRKVAGANPVPPHSHQYGGGVTQEDALLKSAFSVWSTSGYDSTGVYIHKADTSLSRIVHEKAEYAAAKAQLPNYAPGFHAGSNDPGWRVTAQDVELDPSAVAGCRVEDAGGRTEISPSHVNMPVMVFIGKGA